MIVCLFGATYRVGYDVDLERRLDALLLEQLQDVRGFLSFHLYTAVDGEVLGVVRFETREALEAWRDDPVHRSVWEHAPELYAGFWIQNCETYREYAWASSSGRTGEDMVAKFVDSSSNRLKPSMPASEAEVAV